MGDTIKHVMKDRLRAAERSVDIRDANQGYSHIGVTENYSDGHALEMIHDWLFKVAISLPDFLNFNIS